MLVERRSGDSKMMVLAMVVFVTARVQARSKRVLVERQSGDSKMKVLVMVDSVTARVQARSKRVLVTVGSKWTIWKR